MEERTMDQVSDEMLKEAGFNEAFDEDELKPPKPEKKWSAVAAGPYVLVKPDKETGAIKKMSLSKWNAVIAVDLTGPFLCTREFAAKAQELEDLTNRIQQDAAVMGESERDEAERQFRDLQREVARLQNDLQEDWNLRQNEEIGVLQRTVVSEVREYAEAQGYDLIVGEGIVFASTAVNITEEVLEALQADYQAANTQ